MDLILFVAIVYGVGFVNEKLIKGKSTEEALRWPLKTLGKIQVWLKKQGGGGSGTNPPAAA